MFRDIPFPIAGNHHQFGSTNPSASLAVASQSGGHTDTQIIDRASLDQSYSGIVPLVFGVGLNSTTDRTVTLRAKVFHGDEADGSDMAGYEPTGEALEAQSFSRPGPDSAAKVRYNAYYQTMDLRGAKRYIKVRAYPTITTTYASNDPDRLDVFVGALLTEGDVQPGTR